MMNTVYTQKPEMEEIIIQYLPLVKKIVDQISLKNTQYEKEDMISIGILGLMDAYQRYDSEKGIPFQHYAKWRIRGSMIDELRKNGLVSRDKIKKLKQVGQARDQLRQQLLREPSDEEICELLSISRQELYEIEDSVHHLSQYSLEEVLFDGGEGEFQLMDVLEDKKIQSPEERILMDERKLSLEKAIEKLTDKEQLILSLYYKEELTLKEIGEILGVSPSRVSQIHGSILLKLRGLLKTI